LKFTAQKIGPIIRKYGFKVFLTKLNLNFSKIKKLNKNFLLKKHFLSFFKKTCEKMLDKEKIKNKMNDIIEYHNYHTKNKYFRYLKKAIFLSQEEKGKLFRKKLIKRILINNIKELYLYNQKKYLFYRKLHLKKHFIKKWKFIIFMKKNYNIAKLKFISKFFLMWRQALLKIKEKKLLAALKFTMFFEKYTNKAVKNNITYLLKFVYFIIY